MKKKILKLTVIMTAATGIIVSGASDNRAAYAMEETTGKYDAPKSFKEESSSASPDSS